MGNRRGVKVRRGGVGHKTIDAKRTSPCVTAVRNMGATPRLYPMVAGVAGDTVGADDLPRHREERNCMPSHTQARNLLSKCIELPEYAHWSFDDYFDKAATAGKNPSDVDMCCQTPVRWIEAGILGPNFDSAWHRKDVEITRMCEMGDMFSESGERNPFHHEVFVMDVILNRAMCEPLGGEEASAGGCGKKVVSVDPDRVTMVRCFRPEHQDSSVDWKFRTMICYIPAAGVFYCLRERRRKDVGIENTLIPFDMSWLRMRRGIDVEGRVSYGFGEGGYVRRFACGGLGEDSPIPVWRIRSCRHDRMQRVIYRALQCHDREGPKMAPDVFSGETSSQSQAARAAQYNSCLAKARSAKANGRHYANGCHYSGTLPGNCMVIDPKVDPCVDLVIDVAATGCCTDRQTTVMIRDVLSGHNGRTSKRRRILRRCLRDITYHNATVRQRVGTSGGMVRASGGDVGKMYALGTRVELDGVTVVPYQMTGAAPEGLLRNLVVAMSSIGTHCFPEVVSLIQDLEGDTGMPPVQPMDGAAPSGVADPASEATRGETAPMLPPSNKRPRLCPKAIALHERIATMRHRRRRRRQRVGYSIDMSCNMGNSSHFDVHDACQGFCVWTEEHLGIARNWYFIMPNVYGKKLDGSSFAGVAIKLHHGTAISWDGRVVRHCTSITLPDGIDGGSPLDKHGKGDFGNHVYGTFTAAKERIVQAGRKYAASVANGVLATIMTQDDTCADVRVEDVAPIPEADPVLGGDTHSVLDNYVIPMRKRGVYQW